MCLQTKERPGSLRFPSNLEELSSHSLGRSQPYWCLHLEPVTLRRWGAIFNVEFKPQYTNEQQTFLLKYISYQQSNRVNENISNGSPGELRIPDITLWAEDAWCVFQCWDPSGCLPNVAEQSCTLRQASRFYLLLKKLETSFLEEKRACCLKCDSCCRLPSHSPGKGTD